MSLIPTIRERVARARVDLRLGVPVGLSDGGRGGLLVLAAETIRDGRLDAMRALGPVHAALTAWRAETLKIRIYDGDLARLEVPEQVSATWLRDLADPARDLESPMKGPFQGLRAGPAALHRLALTLAKSAQLLPAIVAVEVSGWPEDITVLQADAAAPELLAALDLHAVAAARLPMEASEAGRLHIFRPDNGETEHYGIEIGQPDRSKPVLTRLHSACFTGDVLGSLKCDCGPQLRGALAQMGEQGEGLLLYLNQEGRGIGLANKMRAYALQDQGFDTVDANHRLGFEDDERDFRIGADLLRRMGQTSIRLLTNNPRKVEMMQAAGIEVVERVPLITQPNRFNAGYLDVKRRKSGHLL